MKSLIKSDVLKQNVIELNLQNKVKRNVINLNLIPKKETIGHNHVAFTGKSFRRLENVVFSSNEIFPIGYKKVAVMQNLI